MAKFFDRELLEAHKKQMEAACERFDADEENRTATKKQLKSHDSTEVDSNERVKMRRTVIHRNDALGQERVIGENDLLSINYLEMGLQKARAVSRILIRKPNGRPVGYGTGFLVSPSLLLTNQHVLPSPSFAQKSLAEFDFELDIHFVPKTATHFSLDPDRFFYAQEDLDFTLVAVHPLASTGVPLSSYGFLQLIEESGKALKGEPVAIIQHPSGAEKQIAIRNNRIVSIVRHFLHYETDTVQGSSGSPVFNDQWEVVALHHAGVPKRKSPPARSKQKTPIILGRDGKAWDPTSGEECIQWIANEGTRISAIFADLRAQEWRPNQRHLLAEFGLRGLPTPIEAARMAVSSASVSPSVSSASTTSTQSQVLTLHEFHQLKNNPTTTEADLIPYLQLLPGSPQTLEPAFKLNPALVIDPREGDTMVSWANSGSRWSRHRAYRSKIEDAAASDRPVLKIVSEGDSWFQYPLLLDDVIDHLMEEDDLAVYSLGAAGDTLSHMLEEGEYLQAIEQERPDFFLVSGGGNDMVDIGLSDLLHTFEEGREPKDYLTAHFESFRQDIQTHYHRLFTSLASFFPQLKTLCHGYSYPIPKQGKWLGIPMERNGIKDRELQRNIMRVIMDQINITIQKAATEYTNVHFLDVREIVPATGWYDEFHPTSAEYGRVAAVFIQALRTL